MQEDKEKALLYSKSIEMLEYVLASFFNYSFILCIYIPIFLAACKKLICLFFCTSRKYKIPEDAYSLLRSSKSIGRVCVTELVTLSCY